MKKTLLTLFAAVACLMSYADNDVLMTVDGKPVTVEEFMYIYEKNNQETTVEHKTIEEYLDLFINFKLKVAEAESQGRDTLESFRKELAGYRAQATPKYMQDNEAIDSLVMLSYQRMARNRRAAHIAVECRRDASENAEAEAWAKINAARERVTTGKEDFSKVADEVSTDPGAKENHGELGWITPFRYVYSFEDAIYNTPVGQVTEVFRTPYGLHIALVEEEHDMEEVRAQHIMKMTPRGEVLTTDAARKTIDSIYALTQVEGADFAELAKKLSDDKGSSKRGGELGWFGRGQMVKEFEDAVFQMKDSGEISEPVKSMYGWHIIRLEGKRGIQPYETMAEDIKKRILRDERIKEADKSFLRKTRHEYNLPETMSDEEVRQYADDHLEEKYDELRHLVREYHDGILLFDVSLAEVWDKASQDTAGLTQYFKKHKKSYAWSEPRYKGYFVQCKDEATAKAAKSIIRSANKDSVESYLNHRLNLDSVTYVKFQRGLWKKGQNAGVDKYGFGDKNAEFTTNEELPITFCVGKVLKAPAEWSDERGKVTTDYQDYLEKIWVDSLRQKHSVVVDMSVFDALRSKESK